jgi:hypothetical protein
MNAHSLAAGARAMAAATSLGLVTGASAQAPIQTATGRPLNQASGVQGPSFTRLEQTVGDVDPLGISLRQLSTDLRQPTGFRDVFRINGSAMQARRYGFSATGGGTDLLARMDGAVTAVFPQSVYVATRGGAMPLVPPGTIFFIGALPVDPFADDQELPPSRDRIDSRIDTRAATVHPERARETPPLQRMGPAPDDGSGTHKGEELSTPAPSIMTDDRLRRTTVRMLLMKAADTAQATVDASKAPSGAHPAPPAPPAPAAPTVPPTAPEKKTAPDEPGRR